MQIYTSTSTNIKAIVNKFECKREFQINKIELYDITLNIYNVGGESIEGEVFFREFIL